jgi:hypothetical protein
VIDCVVLSWFGSLLEIKNWMYVNIPSHNYSPLQFVPITFEITSHHCRVKIFAQVQPNSNTFSKHIFQIQEYYTIRAIYPAMLSEKAKSCQPKIVFREISYENPATTVNDDIPSISPTSPTPAFEPMPLRT